MFWRRLFGWSPRKRPTQPSPRRSRLQLETLETRLAPSGTTNLTGAPTLPPPGSGSTPVVSPPATPTSVVSTQITVTS